MQLAPYKQLTYFQPTTLLHLLQTMSATVCRPVIRIRSSETPSEQLALHGVAVQDQPAGFLRCNAQSAGQEAHGEQLTSRTPSKHAHAGPGKTFQGRTQ